MIETETNRNDYVGNGAVDTYGYGFKIFLESQLKVTVRNTSGVETELVLTTDYTVTGVSEDTGGNIVLVSAGQAWLTAGKLTSSFALSVKRNLTVQQESDFRNAGTFYAETHEDTFDYSRMVDQQQQDEIDRSLKLPDTVAISTFNMSLPTDIATADVSLITNPAGDGLIVGPTASAISGANASAVAAAASEDNAELWATKTDGIVDATDYSSKAWSIGGTDVTETAARGASKEWATKTDAAVDTSEFSAKEYATGIQNRGASGGGSAKDWAQYTGGSVDDTEFSAKKYATDAAASAALAAASTAASQWSDVIYVTSGDSPVAVVDGTSGTLYSVDASGGAVVFNLPSISALSLSGPWSFGIKKVDAGANAITVNRDGTDTIGGATSFTIDRQFEGAAFVPDADGTPDDWTTLSYGEVAISGDIVGTTDTQDLSDKTFIDAITFTELGSTPSTPASGNKKFYPKNDGKVYTLDDAGNEVEVGSGSGGGAKNYIDGTDSDFETGIGSWAAYNDATDYVDGTGGTSTISLAVTAVSTEILEGTQSLKITKPASDVQYEGVSILSTAIDRGDQGKTLFINISGDFSNATGSHWEVRAYDVTNSAILYTGPADGRLISPLKGLISVPVYLESDTASIRVSLHMTDTDATGYDMFVDEVKLGPSGVSLVNNIKAVDTYTPTLGNGTNATVQKATYKLVDDLLFFSGDITWGGAGSGGGFTVSLPTGFTINTDKIRAVAQDVFLGSGQWLDSGVAREGINVVYNSTTVVQFEQQDGGGSMSGTTFASGDILTYSAQVYVNETEDKLILNENQLALQTASASTTGVTPTGTITGTLSKVTFGTVDDDDFGMYDTSTGVLTAPRTGKIDVVAYVPIGYTSETGITSVVQVKNTTTTKAIKDQRFTAGAATGQFLRAVGTLLVTKGDTIEIQASNNAAAGRVLIADSSFSFKYQEDFKVLGAVKNHEYIEESSALTSWTPGSNVWADLDSVTLSPGEWDLTANIVSDVTSDGNGGLLHLAISENSGTTTTDHVIGDNEVFVRQGNLLVTTSAESAFVSTTIPRYNVTVTENSKVYYIKANKNGGTLNQRIAYKITARRIK